MSRGSLAARRDLVLLHGWGMHGGIFEPLLAALPEGIGARTIDLPGHGARAARPVPATLEDWAEAVLAEAPPRASWLGWSLGGLVALAAARLAPERVERLILVASAPRLTPAPDWPEGIDPRPARRLRGRPGGRLGGDPRALPRPRGPRQRAGGRGTALPARAPRAPVGPLPRRWRGDSRSSPPPTCAGRRAASGSPRCGSRAPTTASSRRAAVAAGAALAGGRLLAVPRAGHAPFLGRPTEVAAELLGFLAA
ncbi:MAG: alpha/beta hydrolase [Xanthomonadales bacterium]|nr:alpha/beta hydrolase [Xanthomonadales bacterium]